MPLYETTFVARQDLAPADVEKLADKFAAIIKENGGKVVKTEKWGLRNLAYVVKKNRKGHYVYFELDAPVAAVKEYERLAHLNEDVIRLLTVRVKKHLTGATPMISTDDSRFDPQSEAA